MRRFVGVVLGGLLFVAPSDGTAAPRGQGGANPPDQAGASVPRLIRITGTLSPADGRKLAQVETVTLRLYAQESSDTVLWEETQHVMPDAEGRYSLLLGSTRPDGMPAEVFQSSEPRWIGTTIEGLGEKEGPRIRLVSVPYALRASDADTLGGLPVSAFVKSADADTSTAARSLPADSPSEILPGTPTALAKYSSPTDLSPSNVWDIGGMVGINTSTPRDALHVQFTNTNGGMTGLAVQNLGATSTSYSGMLFYDQNGALGQFQGFNNATHEYRINNIARNLSSQFDGSINFMIGSTSRLFVTPGGNVGLGTTTPAAELEVVSAGTNAGAVVTTYADGSGGSVIDGRKARGTVSSPLRPLSGDRLVSFGGRGFNGNVFVRAGSISIHAAEDFEGSQVGTYIRFETTPVNSLISAERMRLSDAGHLGIGTTNPGNRLTLGGETAAFPAALRILPTGDPISERAELQLDSWALLQDVSGNGTKDFAIYDITAASQRLAISPSGQVGLGTTTPLDRLQVVGDVRVGTSGTNGCVKRFDGNALIGTCASDGRFKKNVTPFVSMLNAVSSLRPVHYDWRTGEFPDRHFSANRSYGLIAQEVEQVLPELVVTGTDGYKAVDYTKLPLLAIQAIRELTSEKDALQARLDALAIANDALNARVAELERLMQELFTKR